jgi:hypothetical protein
LGFLTYNSAMNRLVFISLSFTLLLSSCLNSLPSSSTSLPFVVVTPISPTPTILEPTPTYMPHIKDPNFPTRRDPLKWPFSSASIWNMPIGSNAVYLSANIPPAGNAGLTVDEEILILKPEAPLLDVYFNYEGWSGNNRCDKQGELVGQFPIPSNFFVPHTYGTPNSSAAFLMPDARTIKQNQPFHRCFDHKYGTTGYTFSEVDLYGEGITGSHGGSGLSALGGSLRLGELVPGGVIRHALKVNIFCFINCSYDPNDPTPGYRWPAVTADNYAGDPKSPIRYRGKNPVLKMGSLLAIHPSVNLTSLAENSLGLETEAGVILARVLQDYGAYVVDDTAWDVYALNVEFSPDGNVLEEFETAWGFTMIPPTAMVPWGRDIQKIFTHLYVVDNNSANSIGGGGEPRQPLAPDF